MLGEMGRWAARNGMRYKVPVALEAFFCEPGMYQFPYRLKIKPITRCVTTRAATRVRTRRTTGVAGFGAPEGFGKAIDAVDGVACLAWQIADKSKGGSFGF